MMWEALGSRPRGRPSLRRVGRLARRAEDFLHVGFAVTLAVVGIFGLGYAVGAGLAGETERPAATPQVEVRTVTQELTATVEVTATVPTAVPSPPADAGDVARADPGRAGREVRYVVKRGDTLWQLAVDYYGDAAQGMRAIRKRNRLDRRRLFVGEVLVLPARRRSG